MTFSHSVSSSDQRMAGGSAAFLPVSGYSPYQARVGFIPNRAWIALPALGAIAVLCLATMVYGAGVLRILFPAATVIAGLVLYFRSKTGYLAFTLVVWFVSPFVRRIIDLKAGWVDPSPVLLAPLLVTLISGLSLPLLFRVSSKFRCPYFLALGALLFGLGVSLLRSGLAGVTVPLLNFIAPILFGAHIISNWRHCRRLSEALDRTLIGGVLVMGIYGIVQYQLAPAWDTNWMINVDNPTFGTAEPLGIRVFSTLNSPLPFGIVMMVGLLILTNRRGWAGALVPCIGCMALGLSLARTAWLGWATGALVLICVSKLARTRLAISIVLCAIVIAVFSAANPMTDVISKRAQSFVAPKDDLSLNVRLSAYEEYLSALLADPFGQGVGSRGYDIDTKVGFGPHDSAILEIFRCLGWFGGGTYLLAIILLIYQASVGLKHETLRLQSYRAIAIGVIPAALFASVFLSVSGVVFWAVLSLASAHQIQIASRGPMSRNPRESFTEASADDAASARALRLAEQMPDYCNLP
jgi:hypothetical protein